MKALEFPVFGLNRPSIGDGPIGDNLLLGSLWLLPLIGLAIVLLVPKRSESAVKWVALGFTSRPFWQRF